MFFCRCDLQSCRELLGILQKYEQASGQKINEQKSAITFSSKTSMETRERVKRELKITKEGCQGKYLGLPELFGRKKRDLFTSIVDRIKQRGLSWSSKLLSAAGKLVMLKSVLAAMPTYTMTCFKLPANLYKRIQSALTRFWWDSNPEKRKMSWISWKKLYKSLKDGGLGLRDITKFNDALLAKVSWRILTKPECLLSRVLLGKYYHTSSFLNCTVSSSSSHGWRSICCGRDLLRTNLGKIVGNGEHTSLWNDPWLSLTTPLSPMGPINIQDQKTLVSSLLSPITRDWDLNQIRSIILEHETDILKLKISKKGKLGKWMWLPNASGEYSTRSGYYTSCAEDELFNEPDPSLVGFKWKEEIWNLKSSPKMKILLWKATRNVLPVGENLKLRHINPLAISPFCGENESVSHMFFSCSSAANVWQLLPLQSQLFGNQISTFRQGLDVVKRLLCLPLTGLGKGPIFPWGIGSIWTARNNKIFKDKVVLPPEVALQSILRAKEWQSAQQNLVKRSYSRVSLPRAVFSPDLIFCNTDAAWIDSTVAGLRWIFSNQTKQLGFQASRYVSCVASPLMAESLVVLAALHHALEFGFVNLFLASDSTAVIKAIKAKSQSKELHGILHDVLISLLSLCLCLSMLFPETLIFTQMR
ncbi:putative RNA-directed DNA polymerase [Arabidopsis thaliana]